MLTLRPYQEQVKAAVYGHLRIRDDNPCAMVPTAGGKTPIMASNAGPYVLNLIPFQLLRPKGICQKPPANSNNIQLNYN